MKALFFLLTASSAAFSFAFADETSLLPYFQVNNSADESSSALLPLESTHAEVAIAGPLAQVTLTQTFTNEGSQPLDATYLFPASTGAAVHGMTMTIGDRTIMAEIQEKEEAKKTFAKAQSESKSAALLEQHRPNLFQMSVARILPGDEIEVKLHYSELLKPEDNVYQFAFPTTFGPRYGDPTAGTTAIANPFLAEGEQSTTSFSLNLTLSSGLPLQSVESPSHDIDINYTSKQSADLAWQGSSRGPGNDRDLIINYRLADQAIESGILLHEGEDENFLQLTIQPPARVTPDHIPPRDYLFVIDVSGSMSGFPLDTTKELFRNLCAGLRPEDSFNMLLFAGDSRILSTKAVSATKEHVADAIAFLDAQGGRGGTELVSALKKAIALPQGRDSSRSLVVITDGFINFEADAFETVRDNLGRANLFAFGIGSSVNRHLIEGLAAVGEGEPFVVTKPSEAAPVSERFLEYITAPVLTNIKVTTNDCEVSELEPAKIRDLFANRPLSLTAKWTGEPNGSITVSGLTGGGQSWSDTLDLAEAVTATGTSHPSLRPLWARERVRHLADYAKLSEDRDTIAQVANLGLKYSLLTPWTSFVAVDTVSRPTELNPKLAQQPNALPKGVPASAMPGSQVTTHQPLAKNGSVPEPGPVALLIVTLLTIFLPRRRQS
ncbi:VIT and VWA domain-containing protein [Roseibacillus persicicus]|uniref:VIT and vWA domain-containing protein n=1 Tax=Roseibacillus persicicus TaxID=454148 RepID=UPI00398B51ED